MPCASTFVQIATECSMPSYFSFRALAFASLALMAATGCKKDEPAPAKPAVLASALASAAAPIAPAPKPAAKPAADAIRESDIRGWVRFAGYRLSFN